ncbi:hypothetical protein EST38_g1843 [Candolleomyces aberdarensis]|uniref:Uncharacterized protein n=1 Tax=Candolleomyces aberdarensis TaxID=2316362 RepID=A0A4Q2DYA5_9AGAR|nr:hypothetical protein EST38_g1843 [Candolleomyces aberdarensis]
MFLGRSFIRPFSVRHAARPGLPHARRAYRTPAVDTKQDLTKAAKSYANSLKTAKDPFTIHSVYPTFVEELRKTKFTSRTEPLLQKQDVTSILRKLASSGRPEDIQRIQELLYDLEPVFDMPPSLDLYTTIVEGLAEKIQPQVALDFLKKMPTLPGRYIPTIDHFLVVLEASVDQAPFEFVRSAVHNMHRMGCRPNQAVANIVINAFWKSLEFNGEEPTPEAFVPVLDLLELWRIPYSTTTVDLITKLFEGASLSASGQKIRGVYESMSKDNNGSNVWATQLSRVAQNSGAQAAIDLFQSSSNRSVNPSNALRYILRHSHTLSDIELAQKGLEVQCDIRHWTVVISNCARADKLSEALRIYDASRAAGIRPDAGLVAPILRGLWRKSLQKRSDDYLEEALLLYEDLAAASPPSTHPPSSSLRHSPGPDATIYHILFRLLSRAQDVDKYYPAAERLLEDMDAYRIPKDVSPIAAPMICLDIQRSSSPEEAWEAYRIRQPVLDEDGYAIVLQHFSRKQFGTRWVPAIQEYFSIVKDMRRAGIEVTTKVYNILLTQIGFLASKLHREGDVDSDFKSELINVTRRTHDLLSLDASLEPDPIILSQLISTYQRLGCFGDAYRVWELMYLTGNFNCVTVSNILDGCGYANDIHTAHAIWRKLSRDGFSFDLHNWNTWVECLCRCGHLNMARKVVLQDMPDAGKKPTLDTVMILVKFARGYRVEGEVLAQIEKHLPSLYRRITQKSID